MGKRQLSAQSHSYSPTKSLAMQATRCPQGAKKEVSNSPGPVDFAVMLLNSTFNLPNGQVIFFEEFE